MTTYEEWRVTGDPGEGFPPYTFTWSPYGYPATGDAEGEARGFVRMIREAWDTPWTDGPHLHKRTVTDWTEVDTLSPDEEIQIGARVVAVAAARLDELIFKNCPGPHLYRQHRDGKPPWCNACGYTAAGQKITREAEA